MMRGPKGDVDAALTAFVARTKSENTVLKVATAQISARGTNCKEAIKILNRIEESGIIPDAILYSAAIHSCALDRRPNKGHNLLRRMLRKKHITPTVVVYTAVIHGYSIMGQTEEALAVFRDMLAANILPDEAAYNCIINAFANQGDVERVEALRKEMIAADLRPNTMTFNHLIKAYAKADQPAAALMTLRSMAHSYGVAPNLYSYTIAIQAQASAGLAQEAHVLLKEMWRLKIFPNVVTYNSVIKGYAVRANPKKAFRLFREMKERGIVPNQMTYYSLLEACAEAGHIELAYSVLKMPYILNMVSYTLLFEAHLRAKKLETALPFFHKLVGQVFAKDILTTSTLDLHCDRFYTPETFQEEVSHGRMNPEHVAGVPAPVALLALKARKLLSESTKHKAIPFPSSIIVGIHGGGVLSQVVTSHLSELGYTWDRAAGGGRLENIRLKDRPSFSLHQ